MKMYLELALWLLLLYLAALILVCAFVLSFPYPSEAMSGFREQASQCKSTDWLCKAMVQYCQAIPDPCTPTNIMQPWHPENPTQWLNSSNEPSSITPRGRPDGFTP